MNAIVRAPHRIFFFAGGVQLLLASAWWGWALVLRARGVPPPLAADLEPLRVHAFLMIYGFFPLFAFGFLFTAAPRWLHVPPLERREYVPRAIAAGVAALALYPALFIGEEALALAIAALLAAWIWILARILRMLLASRERDRLHVVAAVIAAGGGAVGTGFALMDLLMPWPGAGSAMEIVGVWGFLVPLFFTVSHRMLPFFTAETLPFARAWRPGWILAVLVGASILHGLLELGGFAAWTWIVDAPLACALGSAALRGDVRAAAPHRLLGMLHLAVIWLAFAIGLYAAQSALRALGYSALGLAPMHALGVGYLASVTLAMVSRVSRGHAGLSIAHDRFAWHAFLLLQCAAVARVAADLWLAQYAALLLGAGSLWLAAFAAWSWRYLPTYWQPRHDGRPG